MLKTVIIHGQNHKGSTYHIAHALGEKLGGQFTDLFLPADFGEFCTGCTQCIFYDEKKCPHFNSLRKITAALDAADVIILASPVYVFHATGAMKALLDHYCYRWMSHRPEPSMFRKQAVCITTAAAAGMKSANKDMADSLFNWGIPKIYKLGYAVSASEWEEISDDLRRKIDKKTTALAEKIKEWNGYVRPGIKTRIVFWLMRRFQQDNTFNKYDRKYWEEHGWLNGKKPWNT